MKRVFVCGFNGFNQISNLRDGEIQSCSDAWTEERNQQLLAKVECIDPDYAHKAKANSTIANRAPNDDIDVRTCNAKETCNPSSSFQKCASVASPVPVEIQLVSDEDMLLATWSTLFCLKSDLSLQSVAGFGIKLPQKIAGLCQNSASAQCELTDRVPKGDTILEKVREYLSKLIFVAFGEDSFIIKEKGGTGYYFISEAENSLQCKTIECVQDLKFSIGSMHISALGEDGKLHEVEFTKDSRPTDNGINTTFCQISNVSINFRIKDVSCGKEHVLILSEGGLVLSYGYGSRGQLGHSSTDPLISPDVIECLEPIKVISISAGGWHSLALADTGDIYSWGWNESGQLGIALSPQLMQMSSPQKQDCENDIQLPVCQTNPCLVEFPFDATLVALSCGSRHSAAVSDVGHLWTWGWNTYGQLGHNDCNNRNYPIKCDYFSDRNLKVKSVFCKAWTTIVYCRG